MTVEFGKSSRLEPRCIPFLNLLLSKTLYLCKLIQEVEGKDTLVFCFPSFAK